MKKTPMLCCPIEAKDGAESQGTFETRKYVDVQAVKDAFCVGNLHPGIVDALCSIVDDLEPADVRPVIMCRDCKHYRFDPCEQQMACVEDADEVDGYFSGFLHYPNPDWFCADGEKREN